MRIIAGTCKGQRLFAPKGASTRPTSDRAREATFQLIGPVEGARILDLFAGSGALGLEALSRGAVTATLVESDPAAVRVIERNVAKLGLDGAVVVRADAVRHLASTRVAFDVVFLDPPYEMVESLRMPLAQHLPRALAPGGVVVFETAADVEPELPLVRRLTRRYGAARVTVFEAGKARADGS